MIRFLTLLALLCGLALPLRAEAPLTVFAAASLRGALEEVAAAFPAPLVLAYGGSGTMARQVAAGAPADVVLLANADWMDWLVDQGMAPAEGAQIVARNRLVLIAPSGSAPLANPGDLPARLGPTGRLAIGQRDAVPAGSYAREWLKHEKLWDGLQTQLAETDNVRAALALVARGDTPFGVVYASDAQAEAEVQIVFDVPAVTHTPITYPAVALTPKGATLIDFLTSEKAQAILLKHGFARADHGS
ncbi:Molybdate-binding protein ModA [Sulfitobacter sp. DSM 110093]|uniref:molybdate ABC transporter substrate-binding protein n=1 Tax=Sulfitobacter sp. DSM 110093 TaxID=2883127 RepID=UPI001FACBF4D|nr:molybdate ABC transporter substrate-binding protein [Sulfitobacter sp. DSM 110093]UOA31148.1 Molybdate-binding protein ModA [Sulfitobacter sp. DSM 110093]